MTTATKEKTHEHLVLAMDMLIGDPDILNPTKSAKMVAKNLYVPQKFAYQNFYNWHEDSTKGDAAREILTILDKLQTNSGNARDFALANGSKLHLAEKVPNSTSSGLDKAESSHEAIVLTKYLRKNGKRRTSIITGSGRLPVVARLEGLDVVKYDVEPYLGRRQLHLEWEYMHEWYSNHRIDRETWAEIFPNELPLRYNEFVSFEKVPGQGYSDFNWIGRYDPKEEALVPLKYVRKLKPFGVYPMNDGQAMMMESLMAPPDILTNVIISGGWGSGKTFLTTAVALAKTEGNGSSIYDQIVVCPSDSALGNEQGFLKGDLLEKMRPALGPLEDSLHSLIKMRGSNNQHESEEDLYDGGKKKKRKAQSSDKPQQMRVKTEINWYINDSGYFDIRPIIYMRGRSIPNSIIICDEWQDSDRIQSKRLLTRAALGTKFVALGDPTQIGNRHLTEASNGLVYATRLCGGAANSAVVTLLESESVRNPNTAALFVE